MTPRDSRTSLDRRDFLKVAAVASAAVMTQPTQADGQSASGEWKRTPCRLCGVGCGLLVRIQGGRAVAVKGDPESPVSRGMLCVKGYYSVQALYGRDRLTRALVRKNGTLVPVPMAEALDVVAQRLRDTTARFGAGAAALYGSGRGAAAGALLGTRLGGEG